MKIVIERRDATTPGYKHQLGYTFQIGDGPVLKAAKGSPLAQAIRLVERLAELGGDYT